MCACRAQAYVGAFLRRTNGGREAANAAALEGDLHLDENGQIIRPAARAEDAVADPADAMHNVGTFAQVSTVQCCSATRAPSGVYHLHVAQAFSYFGHLFWYSCSGPG